VSSTVPFENPAAVAALIDHTLLTANAVSSDIERVCAEALEHSFASVCINPYRVRIAAKALRGSSTKVCTVIGFPLGANVSQVKRYEAQTALEEGARELDMVLNIGALRSGEYALVRDEIGALAGVAHSGQAILKVILETCLLDRQQKIKACELASEAGADFVKTSTGFSTSGATAEDVALLRETVGTRLGVKASGGIRTLAALRTMVAAGATRIGTSSGVQILNELHDVQLTGAPHGQDAGSAGY
jgi:deoxyribose-phosphate aldolase